MLNLFRVQNLTQNGYRGEVKMCKFVYLKDNVFVKIKYYQAFEISSEYYPHLFLALFSVLSNLLTHCCVNKLAKSLSFVVLKYNILQHEKTLDFLDLHCFTW